MSSSLSVEDRLAINDLLMEATWGNDFGNVEVFAGVFTPDAIVQNGFGERFPARDFVVNTLSHPGRKGRQHYVQTISVAAEGDGAKVRSYWMAWQWLESANEKKIHALGYYEDFLVKSDGRWKIRERRMFRCSDQRPLPW